MDFGFFGTLLHSSSSSFRLWCLRQWCLLFNFLTVPVGIANGPLIYSEAEKRVLPFAQFSAGRPLQFAVGRPFFEVHFQVFLSRLLI